MITKSTRTVAAYLLLDPECPSVGNNNFWIHEAITLDALQMEVRSSQDSTNDYKPVV